MIRNDYWIRTWSKAANMIFPFAERTTEVDGKKVISFGLSSYGYDIRVGNRFSHVAPGDKPIDPKDPNVGDCFVESVIPDHQPMVIEPDGFVLAETVELFNIPKDVMTICVGKSTYARCGIIVNVTPFEPGWRGKATLEISNTTSRRAYVYAGEGIAQVLFFKGDQCETTYADRNGKYQDQGGLTLPRLG